jgi:cell division protein FtsZ
METHAAAQHAEVEVEAEAADEESIFELDDSEEDVGFENEVQEEQPVAQEHVVSLPVRIATAATPAKASQADPEPQPQPRPRQQPKPAAHPEPALAGVATKGAPTAQPSLNLHQEEVTRFKGTEKTIVEGEDLDVPTWMRMKQRAR